MTLVSADGVWHVETISIDGSERLRVNHMGYFHSELRGATPADTIAALALIVPLDTLVQSLR